MKVVYLYLQFANCFDRLWEKAVSWELQRQKFVSDFSQILHLSRDTGKVDSTESRLFISSKNYVMSAFEKLT